MTFVTTKTTEQLDLHALHRVRERLVSQRTGIINQIRAFLLERGVGVRQGLHFLRAELPRILATSCDALSPRMRLMSVPGIGPIISSAMVAAIGTGDAFTKGRDFAAWLGLAPKQTSTGDRTILGKISKRGNRYLRVLFVQAAWVVLIKPRSWDRHGLKRWFEAASGCITTSSPSRSLTSSLALLGASLLMVELSRRARFGPRDHSTRVVEAAYLPRSAARPDHTCGSIASSPRCPRYVRLCSKGSDRADMETFRVRATNGHPDQLNC
jgi:transposase